MNRKKHIIFDFDGVLARSNGIRVDGFRSLFIDYPAEQRERFIEYVKRNGGMSRYEKIRYFFEEIRKESIGDVRVNLLAQKYSDIVRNKVIKADPVDGSVEFLADNYNKYDLAVVSGSDQED